MYQISFYVPKSHTELVKKAMFDAGAGSVNNSNYTHCSWQIEGEGQFMPTQKANPVIGELDQLEIVPEHKVEMVCASEYFFCFLSYCLHFNNAISNLFIGMYFF